MQDQPFKMLVSLKASVVLCLAFSLLTACTSTRPPNGYPLKTKGWYIDKTEMSNDEWVLYLFELKTKYGDTSEVYRAAMPDSAIWSSVYPQADWTFTKGLLIDDPVRFYPLVGVSYEQIMNYCAWRTEAVNEVLEANNKPYKVGAYRMPTEEEWLWAANKQRVKSKQGLSKIKYFKKGLRAFDGNVSELLEGGDYVIGKSYDTWPLDKAKALEMKQPYQGPSRNVGFRCVVELSPK